MSQSTPDPSPSPAPHQRLLAVLAAGIVVCGATSLWALFRVDAKVEAVERQLGALHDEAESTRAILHLIRLEAPSDGQGIAAVIEQIGYWAAMLATTATPEAHTPYVSGRLSEALDAVAALGADALPAIEARLEESASDGTADEERKWLLRAASRADPEQGQQLLVRVLRGTRLTPTTRLRLFAARELIARDKPLAGQVLKEILEFESAQGITRQVPPRLREDFEGVIPTNSVPEFFNFIARFVESEHPDVPQVLTMIIGRPEHDVMTYQECIKFLGQLHVQNAVNQIRKLYTHPPSRSVSPFFLNTCLQALADIQGSTACEFFEQALAEATHPIVVTKLQSLMKDYCGK